MTDLDRIPAVQEESVEVVVRCRPVSESEERKGMRAVIVVCPERSEVTILDANEQKNALRTFTFNRVYGMTSTQEDIFHETAQPIVDAVLGGFNGTIFAYGQTGTGKSYTMEGAPEPEDAQGVIPRTFSYIFDQIANQKEGCSYLVRVSYLEIYNEEIQDLLTPAAKGTRLKMKECKERGVYIHGLKQIIVNGVSELQQILQVGSRHRAVGATEMNADSSRSHSIFSLIIEKRDGAESSRSIRVGKLNLVDLAGSERQSKARSNGDRLKEGIKINQSLAALGNVISALVDKRHQHIPYRDSKLTRLLQDSLGGNTKTVMIANIGPVEWNLDETMSTLRYANRAKNIQNKPKINEDSKNTLLKKFQDEISRLKAEIGRRKLLAANDGAEAERRNSVADEEVARKMKAVIAEHDASVAQREQSERAVKERERDLAQSETELALERAQRAALQRRVAEMESKVLYCGVNLVEKIEELDRRAAETKAHLATKIEHEREQRHRINELHDICLHSKQTYASLEEEVDVKERHLQRILVSHSSKKLELDDLRAEMDRVREEFDAEIQHLTAELDLKQLLIDSFIPPMYQQKIADHCHYCQAEERWHIDFHLATGNAIRDPVPEPCGALDDDEIYLGYTEGGTRLASLKLDRPVSRSEFSPRKTRSLTRRVTGPGSRPPSSKRPTTARFNSHSAPFLRPGSR